MCERNKNFFLTDVNTYITPIAYVCQSIVFDGATAADTGGRYKFERLIRVGIYYMKK